MDKKFIENPVEAYEKLKQENERLKALLDVLEEDNKKLSKENDVFYNNALQEVKEDLVKRVWNLQTENKELAHYLACMTEQRNKLKQTITDIKEIVGLGLVDGLQSEEYSGFLKILQAQILQKISEVTNE